MIVEPLIDFNTTSPAVMVERIRIAVEATGRSVVDLPMRYWKAINDLADFDGPDRANALFNPSTYNHARLGTFEGPGAWRKPRVEIHVSITRRGNLSLQWYPHVDRRFNDQSDFARFSDEAITPHRPKNELLFVHEIGSLIAEYNNREGLYLRLIDAELRATQCAINSIVNTLGQQFDVRQISGLFLDAPDPENGATAWVGEMAAYERARQARSLRSDFENFSTVCGFTLGDLDAAKAAVAAVTGRSPDPAGQAYQTQIFAYLLGQNFDTTPRQVKRALELAAMFDERG